MSTTFDDVVYDESQRESRPKELHPKGVAKAICVDVIDEGVQENPFKKNQDGTAVQNRRVRLVWETGKKRADGRPWTISKSYNLSLYSGENGGNAATLYTHLSSWLGETWDGRFVARSLVGRTAELFIAHEPSKFGKNKGQLSAKVLAINPLSDGQTMAASGGYKRFTGGSNAKVEAEDDEVGF